MSIRIVPESERTPGVEHITPVLLPAAATPYGVRSARLLALASDHAMGDYLEWSAALVEAQGQVAACLALPGPEGARLAEALRAHVHTPLHSARWQRSAHWLQLLDALLIAWSRQESMQAEPVREALAALQQADAAQRETWANAVLAALRGDELPDDAQLPDGGAALFLWSALSVYWRQLASQLPAAGVAEPGEQRHLCPVCGHAPTGSLVLDGAQAGVRYLQCSLCECQWHMVRTKCTNCDGTGALDYWCLDSEQAPVRAESCGDCGSYLKAFYRQHGRHLEMVADDLATLALDAEMEARELARSGINPLMLPPLRAMAQ